MQNLTARKLLDLLAARHAKDVFVPECKNGPTQTVGAGHMVRMDAWAMRRSWSNPATFGYEIKVSRSDFLGDEKWHRYLAYCSHFSFVTAAGVAKKSEIPEGIGLIVASKNGTRLYTKRKPARRDVSIPENFWRYVLMCRARIVAPNLNEAATNAEYWRAWLAEKEDERQIGRRVSTALRRRFDREVRDVQEKVRRVEVENQQFESIRAMLVELGVPNAGRWLHESQLKQALQDREARLPREVGSALKRLSEAHADLVRAAEAVAEGDAA